MNSLPEYASLEEKQQFFAKGTVEQPWVVNTPEEFDKLYGFLVQKYVEDIETGRNCIFYRGINEAKYQTFTSAQRHWLWNDWEDSSKKGFVEYIATELWHVRKNSPLMNYYRSMAFVPTTCFS